MDGMGCIFPQENRDMSLYISKAFPDDFSVTTGENYGPLKNPMGFQIQKLLDSRSPHFSGVRC